MSSDEMVKKNLDLHAEWMQYVFAHPEALEQIPPGAAVVIIPTDDPELAQANEQTLRGLRRQELPVVVVRIQSPIPVIPTIELAA